MNKEQFINYMNKKLQIIKEEERKDIIDEYINHIDMRVGEGKTEEEAIETFGDIDEMIKEILDAYKIDPHQTNASFDDKMNDIMNFLCKGFTKAWRSITNREVDDIAEFFLQIFLVLIFLGFLRIPFEIIDRIGGSILESIFGYGIGSIFEWIWSVLISIIYFIIFIIVLLNAFLHIRRESSTENSKHLEKTIMDDLKESFNFEQAKEAVHRFTKENKRAEKKADEDEWNDNTCDDGRESEQQTEQRTDTKSSRTETSGFGYGIVRTFVIMMKCFGFLCMLPFIAILIAFCCILGLLIVLSIQGVTFFGFYLLVIGGITGVFAIILFIYQVFYKGGHVL